MSPRVSVVIPLYNKARYIKTALNSIWSQSFRDFEVIVVDDGSTDGGGDLIAQILNPSQLRLVRQENSGEAAARNRGIRESCGMIIAMLDADDEWHPDFLKAIVQLAEKYPEAGIYATGYRWLYPHNFTIETTVESTPETCQHLITDYFRRASIASIVWSSAQAIPRRVFEQIGQFDEGARIGVDVDMWGRIALNYPVGYDSRILAVYHNDLSGYRMVSAFRKSVPFPPFINKARQSIQAGAVPGAILPDLCVYLDRLLLLYAENVVAARNRVELQRVLDKEIYPTSIYSHQVRLFRLGSRLLPMGLLYLLIRLKNSRWISYRKRLQIKQGVVQRVVAKIDHD